jgi:micrococcal nuclease
MGQAPIASVHRKDVSIVTRGRAPAARRMLGGALAAAGAASALAGGEAGAAPDDRFVTRGIVVRAVDGDTLEVLFDSGIVGRVRLVGANAPDRGQCHADVAKRGAEALALGRRVTVVGDPLRPSRDAVGRLIGYVWVAGDGHDVGYRQVLAGRARAARTPFERRAVYLRAERRAQARSSGTIWSDC